MTELQTDFSGGMNDRNPPERLGENQYAYAENIEIRDGTARSRRGSFRLVQSAGTEVTGQGVYRRASDGREVLVTVRDGNVYALMVPFPEVQLTCSETIGKVRFLQAWDYLYMLRGDSLAPLRWDGDFSAGWEAVPAPATGDNAPASTLGAYAYNRAWLVIDGDSLAASDLLSDAFDLNFNVFEIDSGEGSVIQAVTPYVDGSLLIWKDNSTHLLTGCNSGNSDLSTTLARTVLDSRNGIVGPDAFVHVGRDVWFMSRDGVRSVTLTEQNAAQMRDVTASHPIPNLIARINWEGADKTQAAFFDNYVLFAVPIDGSDYLNALLVFDALLQVWVGLWTGGDYSGLHVVELAARQSLLAVSEEGHVDSLLEGLYADHVPAGKLSVAYRIGTDAGGLTAGVTAECGPATGIGGDTTGLLLADLWFGRDYTQGDEPAPPSVNAVKVWVYNATSTTLTLRAICYVGSTIQWQCEGAFPRAAEEQFMVALTQDGTAPTLQVNGVPLALTWITETDKTAWFADMTLYSVAVNIAADASHATRYIRRLECLTLTGTRRFLWTFDEGSGNPTDLVGGYWFDHAGALECEWYVLDTDTAIASRLRTRGYQFAAGAAKRLGLGQLRVAHRNPSLSVDVLTDRDKSGRSVIADQTYSTTEYDIAGRADWDETGATFAVPYRKNYAPVTLPSGGMLLPTAGITLDLEQSHVLSLPLYEVCDWVQLDILNALGAFAVGEIKLDAVPLGLGRARREAVE